MKKLLILCITVLIICCILLYQYLIYGFYLLNSGILSDIIRANVPWYSMMYDAIEKGIYFWSWNMGIGTSMFSHADSICDPFVYILYIFGKENIRFVVK